MSILIILFFAVVGTSFLCSVLESALLSTNMSYISVLARKNPKIGNLLKKLKIDIDKSISSILILNTIANTLGATAIGVQAQNVFNGDKTLVMFISIILTFLILFVAEIIPKTIGAVYWKQLGPFTAVTVKVFIFITYPVILITQFVTKKINKDRRAKQIITKEELIESTHISEEGGIINDLQSDIIENTLCLGETKIKDILTPRSVVYAINIDAPMKEILSDKRTFKFSRVPVYDESIDDMVGIVLTKKLFKQNIKKSKTKIDSIIKPIFSISENIPVSKALLLFIKKKEHMFVVHDSYGQTEGIVTLEDCIETLLGLEIVDELDTTDDMRELALKIMKEKRDNKDNDKNIPTVLDKEKINTFNN